MKRYLRLTTTVALLILTLHFGGIFFQRLSLTYNSEGNFFNESSATVYHEQSIISYGLLTFILLVLTFWVAYPDVKRAKNKVRTSH